MKSAFGEQTTKMPSICYPSPPISVLVFYLRLHRLIDLKDWFTSIDSKSTSVNEACGLLPSPLDSPFPVLLLPPAFSFFLLTPSSPPRAIDSLSHISGNYVNFTYDHQVQIVIASMTVHNYIRRFGRDDGFNAAEQESYNPRRSGNSSEEHDERIRTQRTNDDDMYMAAVRDINAQEIMESSR
ncbi:hypothetical protein LXL04_010544 [Taraxacum kok-saghyz]